MNKKPPVDFFEDALQRQESLPKLAQTMNNNLVRSKSTPAKTASVVLENHSLSTSSVSPLQSPKQTLFLHSRLSRGSTEEFSPFVATASTTSSPYASPYASPRNSTCNLQSVSVNNTSLTSPIIAQRSAIKANSERAVMKKSFEDTSTLRKSTETLAHSPQKSFSGKQNLIPKELEGDVDDAICALSNFTLNPVNTFRICIIHVVIAGEINTFQGGNANDSSSLRELIHPKLPIHWKIQGRHGGNDALYCVDPSKELSGDHQSEEVWLAMFDEKWQNVSGSPIDIKTYFQSKKAVLLSCPVASLVVSWSPTLIMHESAVRSLYNMFLAAKEANLYPFLVLRGSKSVKNVQTRQEIAQYLQAIGFKLDRVHWNGLSSTSDGKFVRDIARLWQTLVICKTDTDSNNVWSFPPLT